MKKMQKKNIWELNRHGQKWTRREEDLLCKLYPDQFNFELADCFGRTAPAISTKANKLEVRKKWRKYDPTQSHKGRQWTEKEVKLFQELYPVTPISRLVVHFPKRSKAAITRKANSLGLKKIYLNPYKVADNANRNLWLEQKDLLIKLYPTTDNKELARLLGRSKAAIYRKAGKLGLHKPCYIPGECSGRNSRVWYEEEEALLKKLYPTTLNKDLAAQLNRTVKAVSARAEILGLKKDPEKFQLPRSWPKEDIKTLRDMWQQGYTQSKIAEIIGKSVGTVKWQLRRQKRYFGLPERYDKAKSKIAEKLDRSQVAVRAKAFKPKLKQKKEKRDEYNHEKKDLLRKLYSTTNNKELAEQLSLPVAAIKSLAQHLGLHKEGYKPDQNRAWTKEEDALVRKLYPTTWTKELAAQLGRTPTAISVRAGHLGIVKDPEKFTRPPSPNAWSEEDIKKLRQLWQQGKTCKEIAKIINKTHQSVTSKVQQQRQAFGLQKRYEQPKRWSKEEDEYVIHHYHKKTCREIAAVLGRTSDAIEHRAARLNVSKYVRSSEKKKKLKK